MSIIVVQTNITSVQQTTECQNSPQTPCHARYAEHRICLLTQDLVIREAYTPIISLSTRQRLDYTYSHDNTT